jgi:ketosteroid isomerase-like protein
MATLTAEQFTQQDQAAVRQLFDDCTRYVNAGDWKSWAEMYSEDGFLQPPNAPTVRGRAQQQAWGEAFPPIEGLAFSDVQSWGEGSLAYGISRYTLKMKDGTTDTGKQLVVLRRGVAGRWNVAAGSFSSDLAAPGTAGQP